MKYPEKESSILEFKEALPQNNQIVKTIVGFCNQNGGKLIIGVKDDGTIQGVPEGTAEQAMEYLDKMIFESTSPSIIPTIYAQTIADKTILIIEVWSGMNKPYFVKSDGIEKGVYIRLGRSTAKATLDIIRELQWSAQGKSFDTMPVYTATKKDLNAEKLKEFFKTRKGTKKVPKDIELALQSYKLLAKEHSHIYPTAAGILLFGKNPDAFFSEAFIIATRFAGIEGREAIATYDCTGTLTEQFQEAYTFVLSKLSRSFTIKGPRRQEELEIPEVALREAIINAIVHRNYHINAPTKIAIYDNRIEIFSPGSFPGPITPKNITFGLTYLRNIAITKVFRELGYSEKLGTGLVTIFDSYRKRGLKTPEIIEGENYVKCILPRPNHRTLRKQVHHDDSDKILNLFEMVTELSTGDIIAALDIPRATLVRKLNRLIKQNILKKSGAGKATHYALAQ